MDSNRKPSHICVIGRSIIWRKHFMWRIRFNCELMVVLSFGRFKDSGIRNRMFFNDFTN